MLVQTITNWNNYQTKNCNTVKKNDTTAYATNTMILPSFVDAKCYANINFKGINDYARNGDLKSVRRELAKGEDVNYQDSYGEAPLHSACFWGRLNVVKYLKEQGADLNIQDNLGWAPLHGACHQKHLDIVKYLKEQGADLNIRSKRGESPLHIVCYNGCLDIVKYLCEQGADLNIQDKDGETPLYNACSYYCGRSDIVKYLCEQDKIDLTLKNNKGNMAVDAAKRNGLENQDWYKILEEKTDYQLAHPETIGISKPLSEEQEAQRLKKQKKQEAQRLKKQEAQEAQRLKEQEEKEQAKINELKQKLTPKEQELTQEKQTELAKREAELKNAETPVLLDEQAVNFVEKLNNSESIKRLFEIVSVMDETDVQAVVGLAERLFVTRGENFVNKL